MTCPDPKACPGCGSDDVYVADRCNYVKCRGCKMSGPVGLTDEDAVRLWNDLPRRGEVQVTTNPICDCGQEIHAGSWHYCYDETPLEGE